MCTGGYGARGRHRDRPAVNVVPAVPGTLTARVDMSTTSTDGTTTNDSAQYTTETYRPVQLVISAARRRCQESEDLGGHSGLDPHRPGLRRHAGRGEHPLFGDAEAPAERDCTEAHGRAHVEDVDKDRDVDVLLHYEAAQVGIDSGDTSACLIGRLQDGSGIYGCAPLPPVR